MLPVNNFFIIFLSKLYFIKLDLFKRRSQIGGLQFLHNWAHTKVELIRFNFRAKMSLYLAFFITPIFIIFKLFWGTTLSLKVKNKWLFNLWRSTHNWTVSPLAKRFLTRLECFTFGLVSDSELRCYRKNKSWFSFLSWLFSILRLRPIWFDAIYRPAILFGFFFINLAEK